MLLSKSNIPWIYVDYFKKSQFRKVKELFNFSKMICKKLLDFIEYENELCALNWKCMAHLLHQRNTPDV